MLAPVETRYARSAMVSSADHVATRRGVAMLRAGGSAADAALAASAVLAVTWPQHCGPGGDLFALVHVPGDGRAGGAQRLRPRRRRAPTRTRLREEGETRCRARRRARGDRARLRRRLGRAARALRAAGAAPTCSSPRGGSRPTGSRRARSSRAAAAELPAEHELRAAADAPGHGRAPARASRGALAAVASDGRDGFYAGAVRRGPARARRRRVRRRRPRAARRRLGRAARPARLGPPGLDRAAQLAGLPDARGARGSRRGSSCYEPGDARWAHALIEAAARRAQRPRPAAPRGRRRARAAGARRGSPSSGRGSIPRARRTPCGCAATAAPIGLAAVDPDGMGVALIQSNYDSWGSGLFAEGIALHNRGAAFSLAEGTLARVRPRPAPAAHALAAARLPPRRLAAHRARDDGRAGAAADPAAAARAPAARRARRPPTRSPPGAGCSTATRSPSRRTRPATGSSACPRAATALRRRPSWSDDFGHAHLIAVEDDHLAGGGRPADRLWQRERVLN